VEAIDAETRARMTGVSWHRGCPVGFAGLRLLTVTHWGFDGRPHRGRLVVNRARGKSATEPPLKHRIVIEWSDATNAYTAEVPSLGVCLSAPTLEAVVRQIRTRLTQGNDTLANPA